MRNTTSNPFPNPALIRVAFCSLIFTLGLCTTLRAQTTWLGGTSANWHTSANWSAGIPDATDDVTIQVGTFAPVISRATPAVAQSVTVQSGASLTIGATGTLTINGATTQGLLNQGTVTNNGVITIGNTSSVGNHGLRNQGAFTNNANADIHIDRSLLSGLINLSGSTFTNLGDITIGAVASVGENGIYNASEFNNSGGEINIDRASSSGIFNASVFNNNSGASIQIEETGFHGIRNND